MATPPGKVPISESSAAGLRFLTDNWQKLLPGAVLMGAVTAVSFTLAPSAAGGGDILGAVLTLAAVVLVGASYYRLAIRNDSSGPGGFAAGRDETSFFGATIWSNLPVIAIMLPAMLGLLDLLQKGATKTGYTIQQILADEKLAQEIVRGSPNGGTLGLLILVSAIVAFWLYLRLSLSIPASVADRKVTVWSTFSWTKGNVWRILAATLLLYAPLFILSQIILSIFSLMLGVNPGDAQSGKAPASAALGVFGFLMGFVSTLLGTAPITGLLAFLYKGLRPPA